MSGYKVAPNMTIPPAKYLDAANWSESYSNPIRLLADPTPTNLTVDNFKALLCERLPSKAIEVQSIFFDNELANLRQKPDEPLNTYYKRVTNLMQRVDAKDRPINSAVDSLILLESTILNTIFRAFIRELSNTEVKKKATVWRLLIDHYVLY